MKFSILTSFYNYLETADDLFNSILNQTYSNWEWVVTDDFSEDEKVAQKLDEFQRADSRVKIIKPRYKKEFYYNFPTELFSGDVIVIIDSDDVPSIKLLEVYKYNYEKFADVISIGCSSIHRKGNHRGNMSGAKYINYQNSSNYIESGSQNVHSSIGDARSYRVNMLKNKGIFVEENDRKFGAGDDMLKTLQIEEWGKFFAIPRILYYYSIRDDSISGGITLHTTRSQEEKKENALFLEKVIEDSKKRVDRKNLYSIEKFYDSSFSHAKNFFFSELENESNRSRIEYWSKNVCIEDILKLNDLYFDHDIFYNEKIENPNYIVVDAEQDLQIISRVLQERQINNCLIVITTSKENAEGVLTEIHKFGYATWFNIFYYTTYKINT